MRQTEAFLRRALPFGLAIALAVAFAHPALAAGAEATLGQKIQNAIGDLVGPILFLITILCTLGGLVLLAKGLLKLKDSHQDPNAFKAAMTTIVSGTILIALPEAAGIGMNSIMGTQGMMLQTSELKLAADALDGSMAAGTGSGLGWRIAGMGNVGEVQSCIDTGGFSTAVPCMAENLAKNVVPIGVIACFAFIYLWGLWGLGSAIFELARHSAERGGGTPQGFWTKGFVSILALSMPSLFKALSMSVMGDAGPILETGVQNGGDWMTYNPGGSGVLIQYAKMIGYIFQILALFGVLAFAKGLTIVKGAGDGRQNATYGHGAVFMLAGVLLANAKLSTCTIMGTITGFSQSLSAVGFCS